MIKIVKLYTTYCVPCKMLIPILNEIKNEYNIEIQEINLDNGIPNEFQELNIMSTPTLLFYKNNELKQKLVGLKTKNEIINVLKSINDEI